MGKRRRFSVSSAAVLVFQNDDLLTEILHRLPAKHLIRFQLVNKHWQSLIVSSSHLPSLHTSHHCRRRTKPTPSFIMGIGLKFYYLNPCTKVFIPFNLKLCYPRILQSCHGLMLVQYRNTRYGCKRYCVYNPTTGQSREFWIENSQNRNSNETIAGLALAFDPVKSPHYKVVCVKCTSYSTHEFWVELYDSGTDTWTRLEQTFSAQFNTKFSNGIFWNNGMYWIRPRSESYYLDFETLIVDTPPRIRIPRTRSCNKYVVTESNGHMYWVSLYLDPHSTSIVVFELWGDISYRLERFRCNLNPLVRELNLDPSEIVVLGMIRGEREDESVVLFQVPGKIIFYTFLDGGFKTLLIDSQVDTNYVDPLYFGRRRACPFIETLIPV